MTEPIDRTNTFKCIRRHGVETTPEQCAQFRSLPRAQTDTDRAKHTRMPAACELCKDWPRMIELVREKRAIAAQGAPGREISGDDPEHDETIIEPVEPGMGTCLECKEYGKIFARGLDAKCYMRHRNAGTLDKLYPRLCATWPITIAKGQKLERNKAEKKPFRRHDHAQEPPVPAEISGITLSYIIPVSSLEEARMAMEAVSTALSHMRRHE